MLYARATLNARGLVYFGLRHIRKFSSSDRQKASHEIVDLQAQDALNRFPAPTVSEDSLASRNGSRDNSDFPGIDNTLRMMMYMFPRQFGLHNVFTSHVDSTQTAQKFQDYTLREEEILKKFRKKEGYINALDVRIPKRLRGTPEHLVRRLQTLHARCSYVELLQHHCPVCMWPQPVVRLYHLKTYKT